MTVPFHNLKCSIKFFDPFQIQQDTARGIVFICRERKLTYCQCSEL
uniref:Uncharacterized protein n=1 Tax=Anguilla anguilla TaxID=7936 RepID=A0A0E9V8U2_ANGAN